MNMKILCPACRSFNLKGPLQVYWDYKTQVEYKRYFCLNCEIEFWTPLQMPSPKYYEESKEEDYDKMHFGNEMELKRYHKLFLKKYKDLEKRGRILEIGCGDGRFLKKMKDLGWDIFGLDMDKLSVENAKRKCKSENIYHCTFDEFIINYNNGIKYDLIVFFEVLEHQIDPKGFIENVYNLLNEYGVIAGSVPDRNRYIVSKRFSPDNPPHHFTLWTSKNILKFLSDNYFKVKSINHTRFEPLFINQIIVSLFFKEKMALWSQDNSITSKKRSFKQKVKRLINPILKGVQFLELPFVYIFRKGICLFFIANKRDS